MTFDNTEFFEPSVFGQTANTNGNMTYAVRNKDGDPVYIDIHDQIGFMKNASDLNAAVINTNIAPAAANPSGYDDTSNNMIQRQWRLLEPQ